VAAQLVDVQTGFPIWSDVFNREAASSLALEEQLARSIVDQVQNLVSHDRRSRVTLRRTTSDSEAFDQYLQGRYFWNHRTDANLRAAIQHFNLALARDSNFSLAWSGLADSYSLMTNWGNVLPTAGFPLARAAAMRALALDSMRAEVHTSLAIVDMFYDHDWGDARLHLERALALDPGYATAHLFHAWYLECQGSPDDALAEMQRAVRLEPLSVIMTTRLGSMLTFLGRAREAVAQFQRAIELDSLDPNPRIDLALAYSLLGRHDSALAALPPLGSHLGDFEGGIQVFAQARAGRRGAGGCLCRDGATGACVC